MKLTTLKSKLTLKGERTALLTPGLWRADKLTSAQRGYGYKWQKAREDWLREHPLCVMCKEQSRVTAATVVDHVIPHRGDQTLFWDRKNWQSLCKPHHDGDKARQERLGL